MHFGAEISAPFVNTLAHFNVLKIDIKFPWGRLEGIVPHKFLAVGAIAPIAPWSRRLCHCGEVPGNELNDKAAAVVAILFVVPPTYEECTSGKVSIRESEDSDYIRGEMDWCPKYPMYRRLSKAQEANAQSLSQTSSSSSSSSSWSTITEEDVDNN